MRVTRTHILLDYYARNNLMASCFRFNASNAASGSMSRWTIRSLASRVCSQLAASILTSKSPGASRSSTARLTIAAARSRHWWSAGRRYAASRSARIKCNILTGFPGPARSRHRRITGLCLASA